MVGESGERGEEAGGTMGGVGGAGGGGGGAGGFKTAVTWVSWCWAGRVWICGERRARVEYNAGEAVTWCLFFKSGSINLLKNRVYSHQESLLVHLLWSGPNTMLIFFVWCGSLSHCPFCKWTRNCNGVFTLVLFGSIESNSSSFPPLVWIFWTGVNTAIAHWCGPINRTETQLKRWFQSGSKLTRLNGWTVEWMNQWIDVLSTSGFVYNFWFTCKKGSVKANHTRTKKINIVFGPDQSKWTSWLSWGLYHEAGLAG